MPSPYCQFQIRTGIQISSMEAFSKAQEKITQRVLYLQKGHMESKAAFAIATVLRLFLKDGFILIAGILQPAIVISLLDQLLINVVQQQLMIVLVGTFLVILTGGAYLGGWLINDEFGKLSLLVGPWIDVFAYFVIGVLMIVVQNGGNIGLVVGAIILIIVVTLLQLIYNVVNFTKSPKSVDIFQHCGSPFGLASYILITCLFFYVIVKMTGGQLLTSAEKIIFSILHLIISCIRFKEVLLTKYYLQEFAQTVYNYSYFTQINLGILSFITAASQLDLLAANLLFLVVTMTLLANAALDAYLKQRQALLFLSSAIEVKGEDEALLYIDCLAELARQIQNEEEDMVLISLRKRHEMECVQHDCFCFRGENGLGEFMKEYVRKELAILTQQFHNSPSVLISILYFRMVIFKFYPQILTRSNQYRSRFELNIIQRFQLYWLNDHVAGFINHRNQEIGSVESEQMFKLQALRDQMLGTMREEIERRQKKWKYLSRGLCQVQELEGQCDAILGQLSRMVQIFEEHKFRFRKSKQFNLLLLFYFLKVSFLNKGRELKANLKEIYYGYKTDELRSLKQFRKFIFHKRSCAIETLVDPKAMGVITNVSLNVIDLFGTPAEKVKGSSINSLMPPFMGNEHVNVLKGWVQTGTWRTIGRLKQVYCSHREQHCFSALLYLKIYVRDGALHFVTNVFKINDCDYLILSPEGVIQGLGRKFVKVLGQQARNLPLSLLIQNSSFSPSRQQFEAGKTYRRVFMGVRGLSEKIQQYREEANQLEGPEKDQLESRIYCWLKGRSPQKYFVQFTVKEQKMGRIAYQVFQIQESRAIEKNKTSYFLSRTISCINSMREHLGEELQVDIQSEGKSDNNRQDEPEDDPMDNLATSSMASISEKENYPLSKMFQRFLYLLRHPKEVDDNRIKAFNLLVLFQLVLLGVLNLVSSHLYRQLFLEVEGVFFADGAVSDIMQTTAMGYAHAYHLRAQLIAGHSSGFVQDLATTRYIQRYVYGLSEFNFVHLGTDVTEFAKKRLYEYIQKPSYWVLSSSNADVDSYQFIENMYYLSKEILQKLESASNSNDTNSVIVMPYLNMLAQNFPQMKRLSQYYLIEYEKSSDESLHLLSLLTIISMVLFVGLSFFISFLFDRYLRFRFGQAQTGFRFLTLVPNQLLQRMKEYYSGLRQKVIETGQLKQIDKNEEQVFGIDHQDLAKTEDARFTTFSKVRLLNYNKYYRWTLVLAIFVLLNVINYLSTEQVRSFLAPSQQIVSYINSLMRGQNRLLEGYFDLKAGYYLNGTLALSPAFFTAIENHLHQAGLQWNAYSNEVSYILKDYDPNFQANFDHALVTNICSLGSNDLTPQMVAKCSADLKLNLLDGGIMISMNFFQRQVWEALEGLKLQYNAGVEAKNSTGGDYFLQLDFQEVDRMQIFMFKIYQLTQSICYVSYTVIINSLTQTYLTFAIVMMILYLLILLAWFKHLGYQKEWLSKLYARLLLIPFSILKNHVRIVNAFKDAIEYSDQ